MIDHDLTWKCRGCREKGCLGLLHTAITSSCRGDQEEEEEANKQRHFGFWNFWSEFRKLWEKEEKAVEFIGRQRLERQGECRTMEDRSACAKQNYGLIFYLGFDLGFWVWDAVGKARITRKETSNCWNAGQREIAPTLFGPCLLYVNMRIDLPTHFCVNSAGYMVEPYSFVGGHTLWTFRTVLIIISILHIRSHIFFKMGRKGYYGIKY